MQDGQRLSPELGLVYAADLTDTFGTLADLWAADLASNPALTTTEPTTAAWAETSFRWLGGVRGEPTGTGWIGPRVGLADIEDAHAVAGETEQACEVAGRALELGRSLKSARCRSYLREFRGRLIAAGGITAAVRLEEEYRDHRLWPQAS